MEEGIFRGLFIKLSETRYSFFKAVVLSSVLFGIWHIAAPVRSLLDGDMSVPGAVMSALVLVLTTGITGAKFCLLTKITGSLWMPMADHFFNNTIINLLHVAFYNGGQAVIEGIAGFSILKENVRVLCRTHHFHMRRMKGAFPESMKSILVQHFTQGGIVPD